MQPIPLIWVIGAAVWALACATVAVAIYARRKGGALNSAAPGREDGLLLGGIAFLAVTPWIPLVRNAFGEAPEAAHAVVPLIIAAAFFAASFTARRRRLDPTAAQSWLTFREKSAGLTLLATAVVYAGYFYRTWNVTVEAAIPAFIASVVLVVVIMIIGHIVIAVLHSPLDELEAPADERDRQAELHATRNAYYVLAIGIWIVPILAMQSLPTLAVVNTALAFFILSELTRFGSLIAFYRFGNQ